MRFISQVVGAVAGQSGRVRGQVGKAALGTLALVTSSSAFGGAGAGAEAMNQVAAMFNQGATLALALLGVAVFVVAGYAVVTKMVAAATGRGSWAEVFIPFIFAGAALVFVGWIVTTGQAQIDAIAIGGG